MEKRTESKTVDVIFFASVVAAMLRLRYLGAFFYAKNKIATCKKTFYFVYYNINILKAKVGMINVNICKC